MANSLTRVLRFAAVLAALAFTHSVLAQGFGETVSAAMDAFREVRSQSAAPENVRAIFAKASEAEEDGCMNFCGFYLGMSVEDARTLTGYYRLKSDEWNFRTAIGAAQVYKFEFSLKGVRRITHGGNSFDELSQAVANRIGSMIAKHNDDYDLIGYEYKNIDGQTALISEKDGLVLEDSNLRGKGEREAFFRNATYDFHEQTGFPLDNAGLVLKDSNLRGKEEREAFVRKTEAMQGAKVVLSQLPLDMVPVLNINCFICKYEVTQALWSAIMGENPSKFVGKNCPVDNVSFDATKKFIAALNAHPEVKNSGFIYRLPTTEEWKYACQAGATGDFCRLKDGTEITTETLDEVAWYEKNTLGETLPVGQKMPNAFGLYDMLGNVWEWTSLVSSSTDNPARCGGSYKNDDIVCNSYSCIEDVPHKGYECVGFRLAADKHDFSYSSIEDAP